MGIETELDQNQIDAALAGKVALARGNGTPAVQGRDLGYNFFLAGVPKINGDEPPQLVGEAGWGFAAPKNSKNVDISTDFLKMMATTEGQKNYAMIYGGIVSAWKTLSGDFSYFKDQSEDNPNIAAAKLSLDHLLAQTQFYGEGFGYPAEVDTIGTEICSKVRLGDITAAEGAKEYQSRCEAQFKQYQQDLAGAA
jgi:ABC-type glycerol-3-phosphate transport system substrate-binding protein